MTPSMAKRKTSEKVLTRRERVFDLVMVEGYDDAGAIAERLLSDGTITSKSIESATRLVQSDLALIRDVTEQKRYVERRLFALRKFRAIAEDDSRIEFEMVTPKGDTVTVSKPRWPAAVRTRALAYFSEEAAAIARVMTVDVAGKGKRKGTDGAVQRHRGCVPIDLSELPEDEREAIAEAMRRVPGGEGGEDAPN